jgi:hypothetical protein
MKSPALAIRRTLDDTSVYSVQNVTEQYYVLVDQFFQAHDDFISPEQCSAAKHDFEYFILLGSCHPPFGDTRSKPGAIVEVVCKPILRKEL